MLDGTLLHPAWRLAEEVFRPCAAAADGGELRGPVRDNIRLLAQAGYFGLGIGREDGGLGANDVTRREFTEIVASACGVTAFTQQQLQIGIGLVVSGDNPGLKRVFLPSLARGEMFCGVALSHLRRSDPPPVTAGRVPGGFRLSGQIPWITGWELLDCFVLGAVLGPQEEHLFVLVDKTRHAAHLQASPPVPLSVMQASGTVEVGVDNLVVSEAEVLRVSPASDLRRREFREITSHTALPLGCARGAASCLRGLALDRRSEELSGTAMTLAWEIDQSRRESLVWGGDCADHSDYKTHALRARAGAYVLALRAAQAAVVVTGGSAHRRDAAPQRLLREAQFYTTVVQTPDVQKATLDALLSPLFGL